MKNRVDIDLKGLSNDESFAYFKKCLLEEVEGLDIKTEHAILYFRADLSKEIPDMNLGTFGYEEENEAKMAALLSAWMINNLENNVLFKSAFLVAVNYLLILKKLKWNWYTS